MNLIVALNPKNQFQGKIEKMVAGPLVSEILIDTPAGLISSVITTSSAKELSLQTGTPVLALFKATEVSLARPESRTDTK